MMRWRNGLACTEGYHVSSGRALVSCRRVVGALAGAVLVTLALAGSAGATISPYYGTIGAADADGNAIPETPTAVIRVALSEPAGGGTQMTITTAWASDEGMEWMLATGTDVGMTTAVCQIDELLGLPARARSCAPQ